MKKKTLLNVVILFFSVAVASFSQTMKVSGRIIDESDKTTIIGAIVNVKGSSVSTITDVDGKYSIQAKKGDILLFSFMGMESQTVPVGNSAVINVTLRILTREIDEIVVIGYSAVKKSDLTGSVQSIRSEDLMKSIPTSLEQGLQGRLAGVNIIKNDGAPGGGISMQIRGSNSFMGSTEPLYVIDGVPITASNDEESISFDENEVSTRNAISFLDPNDIESVEVLKDASATAIYGSRGANGVVMITTKSGRKGKDKINFSANLTVGQVSRKLRMLTGAEYAEYRNQAYINTQFITNGTFNPINLPYLGGKGSSGSYVKGPQDFGNNPYYWQDAIFRTSFSQSYNLNYSGASDQGDHSIGVSFLDQSGTVMNSAYNRLSTNIKINRNPFKWLKIGTTTNLSLSNSDMIKTATNNQNNGDEGVIRSALYFPPIYNKEDGVGYEDFQIVTNPLDYANAMNKNRNVNIYSSNYANVILPKGFILRTVFSYRASLNFANRYFSKRLYEGRTVQGSSLAGDTQSQTFSWDNFLMYNRTFNGHNVSGTLGTSWENYDYYSKQIKVNGFGSDMNNGWILGDGTNPQGPKSVKSESSLFSIIARAAYNYNNTYFLTATLRRDASSKFATNNKVALFPSAGLAWRATGENFLKDSPIIDNLKFRYSFGSSGNAGIGPYGSLPLFQGANYPFGSTVGTGYAPDPTKPGNPNLKWETTYQHDIGFDLTMFKGLNIELDYYYKTTKDLIQSRELAPSSGQTSVYENIGEVRNTGIELTANYRIVDTKDLMLSVGGNFSVNNNTITSLGGGITKIFPNNLWNDLRPFIITEGRPIGQLYGYVEEGIWNSRREVIESSQFQKTYPNYTFESNESATELIIRQRWLGEIKIKDRNGDGSITEEDQDYIGNVNPKFLYALNANVTYKDFDLSILFNGVQGNDIINMSSLRFYNLGQTRNVPKAILDGAWTPETGGANPKIFTTNARDVYFTRRYIEDGSYLKLRNLSVGYTLRKPFKFIESIRIYASGNNLFTISSYTGYDPEVNAFGSNSSRRGVDAGGYPQSRDITLGINVTL